MPRSLVIVTVVVAVAAGVFAAFALRPTRPDQPALPAIEVLCATALRQPLTELAPLARSEVGVELNLRFGSSGDLLAQLAVAGRGDLFIAADATFVEAAREKGLVREVLPLARQRPVLAVRAGNPLGLASFDDALARPEVRIGMANPEAASIGKVAKRVLGKEGRWEAVRARLAVTKPTVMDVATDVAVGSLDAAIVWDSTIGQVKGLQAVDAGTLGQQEEVATIGVLATARDPAAALAVARLACSPEHGAAILTRHGFRPEPGDRWAKRPEVVLYSGSVNRPAVDGLLKRFAEREGVGISTTYNGCGILCASMVAMQKGGAGAMPDAYYACDICFVPPVAEHFPEAVMLTEAEIVIAVPKGNPRGLASVSDLAREGLKIGVCNAEQSTLGFMTGRILKQLGLQTAVMRNAASQVPTGDLLVNQLRTGSLDAAIVYRTNIHGRLDVFDAIPLAAPGIDAKAVQPFAVRKDSPHRRLMGRLLVALQAEPQAFTGAGFVWRADQRPQLSAELPVPEWLKGAGAPEWKRDDGAR